MDMEAKIQTTCGGCLARKELFEPDAEVLKIYEMLVSEKVEFLSLCRKCIEYLREIKLFSVQCCESLSTLLCSIAPKLLEVHVKTEEDDLDNFFNDIISEDEIEKKPKEFIELQCLNCPSCSKEFMTRSSLDSHMCDDKKTSEKKSTTTKNETCTDKEECEICRKKLLTKIILKRHMERVHKVFTPKTKPTGKDEKECEICQKKFAAKKNVIRHIENVHKIFTPKTRSSKPKKIKPPEPKKPQEPVLCDHCGQSCGSKSEFRIHWRDKHRSQNHQCSECSKVFTGSIALRKHLRRHHQLCGGQYCIYCGCSYSNVLTKEEFKKHVESEHSYICHICGFTSKYKTSIKMHIRGVHKPTSERYQSVTCPICNKPFRNKERLQIHHEKKHMEGTLQCPHCPEKLLTQTYLNKHIYTKHTFKSCEYCDKEIPNVQYGAHVRRTHKKIKNYQCKLCGSQFFQRLKAVQHLHAHGNTKPMVCHICAQGFVDVRTMTNHYKTSHGMQKTSKEVLKMVLRPEPEHSVELNIVSIAKNNEYDILIMNNRMKGGSANKDLV